MAHVYVTLPLKVVSQKLIVAFLDYTNSRNVKMLLSWIFIDFFQRYIKEYPTFLIFSHSET